MRKRDIWRSQRELELWIDEQRDQQSPENCNGSSSMVKNFFQKCVMFSETDRDYATALLSNYPLA